MKKKRMVRIIPKEGWMSKAVREYFKDLKDTPSADQKFKNAVRYGWRCYTKYGKSKTAIDFEEPLKKRRRSEGGGRKTHAPEFRDTLFEWFIGNF